MSGSENSFENKIHLNFEGPPRESIFHKINDFCLSEKSFNEVEKRFEENIDHLLKLDNDRALALVGSIIVENHVDELISSLAPGYKNLIENKDYTFSLKIELAKSLRICPIRFFTYADNIRAIRNQFAHNLKIESFSDIPKEYLRKMHEHVGEACEVTISRDEPDREVFAKMVLYLILILYVYSEHVKKLNNCIRDTDFYKYLSLYCEGLLTKN